MKKSVIYSLSAVILASTLSGCSLTGEPETESTSVPTYKPAAEICILDDYALLAGHTLFTGADDAYSIQIPEGSTINNEDPDNITITINGEFDSADFVNIIHTDNATVIDTEQKLMDMLENDNSIDITGFFLLKMNVEYKGYKYTYTATQDPQLKGIKSTYFSSDGTAYVVTATINNGGDEINMTNINTVVDTFINNR